MTDCAERAAVSSFAFGFGGLASVPRTDRRAKCAFPLRPVSVGKLALRL